MLSRGSYHALRGPHHTLRLEVPTMLSQGPTMLSEGSIMLSVDPTIHQALRGPLPCSQRILTPVSHHALRTQSCHALRAAMLLKSVQRDLMVSGTLWYQRAILFQYHVREVPTILPEGSTSTMLSKGPMLWSERPSHAHKRALPCLNVGQFKNL